MIMGELRNLVAKTCSGIVLFFATLALASAAAQEQADLATTTYGPQELVRRMVARELQAQDQDHSKWRFISSKREDGVTKVFEKVQTVGGTVKRTISVNGRSLSPSERAQEEKQLQEFLRDPGAQQKKRKDERQDAEKAKKMFQTFPDAFLYTRADSQDGMTVLHFVPNPKFDPPTREAMVFHAMSGTMWIDTKQLRFAKMQAALTDDVKFGWGLLGHLDRGGTMLVEQKEIAPGHWEVTNLDLNLQGKAIFFKNLSVQEQEHNYGFQKLDEHIDLAQGVQLLVRGDEQLANQAGGK